MHLTNNQYHVIESLVYYMTDAKFNYENQSLIESDGLLNTCITRVDRDIIGSNHLFSLVQSFGELDGEELKELAIEESLLTYIEDH